MKVPIEWYNGNLDERLRLARQYVYNMLDEQHDRRPYFGVHCDENGQLFARNGGMTIDLPHITGRALDILFSVEEALGESVDTQMEKVYTDYYYGSMDPDLMVPVYLDWNNGETYLETHNLREAAEALAHMIICRKSGRASRYAEGFMDTLTKITDAGTGAFSDVAADKAITNPDLRKHINGSLGHPYPVSSGRLTGALVQLYHATGDEKMLQYAGYYAKSALTCFYEDGTLNVSKTGNHVHSITSTMSGILNYAMETGNTDMINQVRQIYKNGFEKQDYMSSYGWIKEQIELEQDTGRGEINQVGDMIQVQLGLAQYEDMASWYHKAEVFMRGMLLPSQVICTDEFCEWESPDSDAKTKMLTRAIGGWGFPSPNAYLVRKPNGLNTIDITQGAVQGICAFKRHIITRRNDLVKLNLYFDTDNEIATVSTRLPLEGKCCVVLKQAGVLAIRIPQGCQEGSLHIAVNDKEQSFLTRDGYAYTDRIDEGMPVSISFKLLTYSFTEMINKKNYNVTMYGEQTIGVTPQSEMCYLYKDFPTGN